MGKGVPVSWRAQTESILTQASLGAAWEGKVLGVGWGPGLPTLQLPVCFPRGSRTEGKPLGFAPGSPASKATPAIPGPEQAPNYFVE